METGYEKSAKAFAFAMAALIVLIVFLSLTAKSQTFGLDINYTAQGQSVGSFIVKDIYGHGIYIRHYDDENWDSSCDTFTFNQGYSFGVIGRVSERLTGSFGLGKYRVSKHIDNTSWEPDKNYLICEFGCTYEAIRQRRFVGGVNMGISFIPGFGPTILSGIFLGVALNR